jgi:NADH-quinone oxidoreductase subunit L
MLFLTFHGPERFRAAAAHGEADDHEPGHDDHPGADDHDGHGHDPKESPWVVTVPLIALAIPSVLIGAVTVAPVLFGSYFGHSIFVLPANDVVGRIGEDFGGALSFALHGLAKAPFWFAAAGVAAAWLFFLRRPELADETARRFRLVYRILSEKYYFDWFNENILAALTRGVGVGLWKGGDQGLIDGAMVDGTAAGVGWFGGVLRRVQSGYLYSYAFWMVIGLAVLLGWYLTHP